MPELTDRQEEVIDSLIQKYDGEGEQIWDGDDAVFTVTDGPHKGTSVMVAPDGATNDLEPSAGEPTQLTQAVADSESSDLGRAEDQRTDLEAAPPAAVSGPSASTDIGLSVDPRAVEALTAADERQIMAEIQGHALGAMVYSFRQGGGNVTGLSWKGVQEAVRQMNTRGMGRIKVASDPAPDFEEITVEIDTGQFDDDGQPITESRRAVRVTVYAVDEVYGSGRYGTAIQTRQMKTSRKGKDGRNIWKDDIFADTKALSKAQRNAMEGMLPLQLVEELKTAYLGKGQVEYINATAVDVTDQPPALTDDRAKQLGDDIRKLYAALKREHPDGLKAMTPAAFNRYFEAAQHDHDRLEDFKTFMEDEVVKAVDAKKAAA